MRDRGAASDASYRPLPTDQARWARGRSLTVAAGAVALQLAVATGYGFHRDELYFLAESRRLAWGFVSEPPFTPALARVSTALFGESLLGLRLWPALAGGLVVLLATLITRTLGGGRVAQVVAGVCVAGATTLLAIFHLFGTSAFDQLAWVGCLYLVVRLLAGADPRWWLGVGAVAGVGLLNKYTLVLLALGLVVGLLLTPAQRHHLRSPWLWAGAGVAAVLAAPSLAWQYGRGWPFLEVAASISDDEGGGWGDALLFLPWQVITMNAFLAPVWVAGLWRLARSPVLRPLAWTYGVLLVVLAVVGGKFYYLAPLYVVLFAAGGVATERWLRRRGRPRPASVVTALAVAGAVGLPIALPVLPYGVQRAVPISAANPDLLETIGWPRFVAQLAAVRDDLPAAERAGAVVLTRNYGEAGAVERFGPAYGLGRPVSGHNTYWLWGPPADERATVIAVGFRDRTVLDRLFTDVRRAGAIDNGVGIDNQEQGAPIWVCRAPREPWPQQWPLARRYDA